MRELTEFTGPGGERGFRECAFYSCDESVEEYTNSDPHEEIAKTLDSVLRPATPDVLAALKSAFGGEILTVYGYTRRKLDANEPDPAAVLERVIEDLDDEYGGGDDPTDITAAMQDAAAAFVAVIRAEYQVWQCEQTHSAQVNIEAWVREHRPDWLESPGGHGAAAAGAAKWDR